MNGRVHEPVGPKPAGVEPSARRRSGGPSNRALAGLLGAVADERRLEAAARVAEARPPTVPADVRIQVGVEVDTMLQDLRARAATLSRDVFVRREDWESDATRTRLLAHELEHVEQQRRTGARLQRQRADAGSDPIAGPGTPAPVEESRRVGDTIVFQGIPLSADEAQLHERLIELVADRGDSAIEVFVASFEEQIRRDDNDAHPVAGSPAAAFEAADRLPTERAIAAPLRRAATKVKQEDAAILAAFEATANELVRTILTQGDALLDEQLNRYAVTTTTEERLRERGERRWQKVPEEVALMGETPDTAALATAATAIAAAQTRVRELERERRYETRHVAGHTRDGISTYEVPVFDPVLEQRIAAAKQEHARVIREKARAHPILYAGSERLAELAARGQIPSRVAASEISGVVRDRRQAIQEVRDQIGKRYSVWRQPLVLALTVQRVGVAPGGREDTLVHDKARAVTEADEETRATFEAIAFVLGLIAFAATLGGSAVLTASLTATIATLDTARFADDLGQYQLDMAATRTALDPEQALSQREPSLAPLVADVFAIGTDVIALGAEARTLSRAARAAPAAVDVTRTAGVAARSGETFEQQVNRWIDELLVDEPRAGATPISLEPEVGAAAVEAKPAKSFHEELGAVDLSGVTQEQRATLERAYRRYATKSVQRLRSQDEYIRYVWGKSSGQLGEKVRIPGPGISGAAAPALEAGRIAERIQGAIRNTVKNERTYTVVFADPVRNVTVSYDVIPDFMPTVRTDAAGRFRPPVKDAAETVLIADSKFTWDANGRIAVTDQIRAMIALAKQNDKPFVFLVRAGADEAILSSGITRFADAIGAEVHVVPDPTGLIR